jgi:hypothetical protein
MLGSPLVALSEQERRKWYTRRTGGTWGRVCVVRKAIDSCPVFYTGPRKVRHSTYTGLVLSSRSSATSPFEGLHGRIGGRSASDNPVQRAWARVESGEIPEVARELANRRLRKLAALCYYLGEGRNGRFFLDVRTAGKLLGVSKSTAGRRLKAIVAARLVRVVRKGWYQPTAKIGQATEIQWVR